MAGKRLPAAAGSSVVLRDVAPTPFTLRCPLSNPPAGSTPDITIAPAAWEGPPPASGETPQQRCCLPRLPPGNRHARGTDENPPVQLSPEAKRLPPPRMRKREQ